MLIVNALPFHCKKSPSTVGAMTKSKLPVVSLKTILLLEPPVGKLNDPVNAEPLKGLFAVHASPVFA